MKKQTVNFFWFRRDLRLDDNTALFAALRAGLPVIPVFIFDEDILTALPKNDARVTFIYDTLTALHAQLRQVNVALLVKKGNAANVWATLQEEYDIKQLFFNHDYEPDARQRDADITDFLSARGVTVNTYKDQVIFEMADITKKDGQPYTIYTPYKNQWLAQYQALGCLEIVDTSPLFGHFYPADFAFPPLQELGFERSNLRVLPHNLTQIAQYHDTRDFPALDSTSYLSPHLRFGTVSIRKLVRWAHKKNLTFLSELIWREFFMQILFHFPASRHQNFKSAYDCIQWRNDVADFQRWCAGKTGYPLVDAGMRQLNATGYLHNRVRMVVASFLCKHLLISWQWGEAYFAEKLLDFDLAANVGNWQWAAGTGCDAAPYFRVFNPALQQKKFDEQAIYIRKWLSEADLTDTDPMVEHAFARNRAIATYKAGLALASAQTSAMTSKND